MSDVVLDASAVLALVNREPGAAMVAARLPNSAISAVNLAEVFARLSDIGLDENACRRVIAALGLRTLPFDEDDAAMTGALRADTRPHGLSLGDRACLGLAKRLGVQALTADRAWANLPAGVNVIMIR